MSAEELTDEQIVARIREGDEGKMFSRLHDRYADRVRSKCRSLLRNESTVEDAVQDIFLKVHEKLPGFQGRSRFSTWLYSITYNHCIEFLRKNKRIRFADWEEGLDLPEEVEDEDIEFLLEEKLTRASLLLEMIKPEDKAILIMKYRDGFSIKQIMEILGIAGESATKMKLNRAKKRIIALQRKLFKN